MTPLLAYLVTVIATAAAVCGHATQPFPPLRWWRALAARRARARDSSPTPALHHGPGRPPGPGPRLPVPGACRPRAAPHRAGPVVTADAVGLAVGAACPLTFLIAALVLVVLIHRDTRRKP